MTWDPVHDSRETFLACLGALCAPGAAVGPLPTTGLSSETDLDGAVAILLSLLDVGLVLAVDGDETARAMAATVCALTGAQLGDLRDADVVLVRGDPCPGLSGARRGTPSAPHTGATVVVSGASGRTDVVLSGPGVDGTREERLPLDRAGIDAFVEAGLEYPCGVDALIVADGVLVALPRSVRIRQAVS